MKHKITFLFSSLLILFAFTSSAEEKYYFWFDTVYAIHQKANFETLRVIDMRENKKDIGYLRLGAFNKHNTIIPDPELTKLLPACYEKIIQQGANTRNELLLVLYGMNIEDRPSGDETGTFYFDGDFYLENNGRYTYAGTVDTLIEVGAAADVSKKLMGISQYAICNILGMYATKENPPGFYTGLTETELLQKRKNEKLKYPIYNAAKFEPGIYYTVDNFINNTPVDTPFITETFYFNGERRHLRFYYKDKDGKKGERIKEGSFFAIYTGKEWALSENPYAISLRKNNDDFYAIKTYRAIHPQASVFPVIAFGYVGVLMVNNRTDDNKKTIWGLYESRFNPVSKDFVPVARK